MRREKRDPLAQLVDHVGELTQPYPHLERYFHQRERRTKVHVQRHPSLLDQLRAAADPSAVPPDATTERSPGGFESKAAANVVAVDKLTSITDEVEQWREVLGWPHLGTLEADMHALVGAVAQEPAQQKRAASAANRWWTWCRVLAGWQSPPWRPPAPCPTCSQMPGEKQGLWIRLDIEWAVCLACSTRWTSETIHELADHIRSRSWE